MLTAITSVSTAALAVIVAVVMLVAPATPRSLVEATSSTAQARTSAPTSSSIDDSVVDDGARERAATVSRSLGVGRGATSTTEGVPAPTTTAPATPPPPATPSVDEARSFALSQIGEAQFSCLDVLWQHESDWDPSAENPASGAYGIAQALPGTKMASVGDDWVSNPITQVSWGLAYITARYGSACNAWSFWLNHYPHWY